MTPNWITEAGYDILGILRTFGCADGSIHLALPRASEAIRSCPC